MAYADASDIEQRLGRVLDESEQQIVETRLDDAEELIFFRIPDLAQKIADGKIRERLVVMVEAEAVMRLIKNPEGFTSETDGNYTYQISARVASGRLTIEDDEWKLLGVRSSVGMVQTKIRTPGSYKRNPNWCFEAGSGSPYCAPSCSSEGCDTGLDTAVWA